LDNFVCFCGNGMIESMLEPHLKESAGANQTQVDQGAMFEGNTNIFKSFVNGLVLNSENICCKINFNSKYYLHCFHFFQVGLTFLILGGMYMVTTPFVGYVSISFGNRKLKFLNKYLIVFVLFNLENCNVRLSNTI
jgi:hypothetical protein